MVLKVDWIQTTLEDHNIHRWIWEDSLYMKYVWSASKTNIIKIINKSNYFDKCKSISTASHLQFWSYFAPQSSFAFNMTKQLKLARSGSTSANICNFMKTEYSKVWDKNFTIFKWLLLQRVICRNFWGQGWHDKKIARSRTHIKSSSAITVCLAKKFYIFKSTWQTYHTGWQLSLISFSLLTWALTLAPISGVTLHQLKIFLDWFLCVWFCLGSD